MASSDAYVVEPVFRGTKAHLVMLGGEVEAALRVNGRSAPAITLLDPGDQIQLAGGTVLHLALFHHPGIGPAGEERAGRECPYCRGDLQPEELVYVCHGCGRAMHFGAPAEGGAPPAKGAEDGAGEEEGLRCATLCPSCPVCATPVVLTEGYTTEPGAGP